MEISNIQESSLKERGTDNANETYIKNKLERVVSINQGSEKNIKRISIIQIDKSSLLIDD